VVQHLAVSAQQAEARPSEARDAAELLPEAASAAWVGVARLPVEGAVRDAAERRRAAPDAAGLLAVRPLALQVVPSALLSAGAWAFRQDPLLPLARPAPQPAALIAHRMPRWRIAWR
jgi:hypothetical protein